MKAFNRYLFFFIIVSIGLVVSWGKVGQNRDKLLGYSDAKLLIPEANCFPRHEPCAAYGLNQALVLGPHNQGLMLKYKSNIDANDMGITADYVDDQGKLLEEPLLLKQTAKHEWFLSSPPKDKVVKRLKVELSTSSAKAVTIFDL